MIGTGRSPEELQGFGAPAHEVGEGFIDNLDHLLAGSKALHHLLAHDARGNPGDKVLGDLVMDIGFQQRHADFAKGFPNVFFGQFSLPAKILKNLLE